MKKWLMSLFAVLFVFSVAACGTADEDATNGSTDTPASEASEPADDTETNEDGQTPDEEESTDQEEPADENGSSDEAELPEQKDLTIYGEMKETKTAQLTQSDLGYYIYLLDGYQLEAEEPNRDVLLSDLNDEFFVRIEPLPADANMEEVKKNAKQGLEAVGEVQELDPAEIREDFFKDAAYYMSASTNDVSVMSLAQEIDGQQFRFTLHFPNKEEAEGITPGFWAMMRSIAVR